MCISICAVLHPLLEPLLVQLLLLEVEFQLRRRRDAGPRSLKGERVRIPSEPYVGIPYLPALEPHSVGSHDDAQDRGMEQISHLVVSCKPGVCKPGVLNP